MPLLRVYSRNLGQCSILARKGNFLKKGNQKFFILHRNKTLYNFRYLGQILVTLEKLLTLHIL